jgi:hypothetical protein
VTAARAASLRTVSHDWVGIVAQVIAASRSDGKDGKPTDSHSSSLVSHDEHAPRAADELVTVERRYKKLPGTYRAISCRIESQSVFGLVNNGKPNRLLFTLGDRIGGGAQSSLVTGIKVGTYTSCLGFFTTHSEPFRVCLQTLAPRLFLNRSRTRSGGASLCGTCAAVSHFASPFPGHV